MKARHWLAVICAATLLLGVQGATRVLRPIAAGTWYPAEPDKLRADVEKYIAEADVPIPEGRVVACIVPHMPYQTAGAVIGAAFKTIPQHQYDRVILLAPAHYSTFRGCSIPSVQACRTPLGDVLLDGPAVRLLDRSTLIEVRSVQYGGDTERKQVHEREYTIEAILPFLQVRLGAVQIVPVLCGDFLDYQKHLDDNALTAVAKSIQPLLDERTLLVVSSDFTHFGNTFSYRPFRENIIENIEGLDQQAFKLIVKGDGPGFEKYLEETRNTICGKNAINILLKLLPKHAQGHLLKYDLSARITGDTRSSISFASIVFVDPSRPAAADMPGGGTQ